MYENVTVEKVVKKEVPFEVERVCCKFFLSKSLWDADNLIGADHHS